jgi:REP element-mobilizing transposase RayT
MSYTSGSHTAFHHRYHIVWITRYRYKVLEGALRERIRTIIRQVCKELGVLSGVLSREHVHMFVEIPPHIAVRDFARRVKGRSSQRSNLSRSARPPGPLDLARAPTKLIFSSRQMPPIDGFRNARQFCTESEADPFMVRHQNVYFR